MYLIIIIVLQFLLLVMAVTMHRITKYRLLWIVAALASGIMVVRNIILLYYNGNLPKDTYLSIIISNLLPILVLLLIIFALLVFYHMYKARINLELNLRQREQSAKDNLIISSAAVEQSPSVVVITDLEGNIEYVNPKFSELTGYTKDEVLGKNPRILKSGYFKDSIYKELWDIVSSGGEWRGEFLNKKKTGEFYWEAASISSIKDNNGSIKNYLAVKEDITEKKNIEEALFRSERRMKDVQRVAHIGTWERDEISKKAFWSDENYRILGLEPGEIEPGLDYFKSIIHPEDRERVIKAADNSRANHKENNEIFRLILKDGTEKYVNDWSHYSYNADGLLTYSTGMMQDITRRIENEESIKASLEEKKVLLKELYHRTKNNMQVIISMLNLNSSRVDDKRVSDVFTDVTSRIQSMSLVHEKLYQSQNLSSVSLKEYIEDLCFSLKGSYCSSACKIDFFLNLDDISVSIDAAIPLGLILSELISNSFKHAFKNQEKGAIHISLKSRNNSQTIIEIHDSGIGNSSDINVNNLTSMGLQTVYALAEYQLHGNIELYTGPGFKFGITFNNDVFKSRV